MPQPPLDFAKGAPDAARETWLLRIRAALADDAALARVLTSLSVAALPAPPRAEPGGSYGRALLYRDDRLEVMQAGWAEGAQAEPHDHGPATGAVVILSGSFREQVYRLVDGELLREAEQVHRTGAVMPVRAGLVHSLEALGEGCTLHVYAPPVTGMRIYDCRAREVLQLSDEHGAWLPRDVRHVLARRSFREVCDDRR